jgi:hypothetical protein
VCVVVVVGGGGSLNEGKKKVNVSVYVDHSLSSGL